MGPDRRKPLDLVDADASTLPTLPTPSPVSLPDSPESTRPTLRLPVASTRMIPFPASSLMGVDSPP